MAIAVMAPLKHQRYVSKKEQSLVPLRFQTRKFKRKRRVPRTVPRAPFNDSSFLMRVRRAGGLASSPPSVFQSSVAYRDFLDHEDYGYGSMAGFLRLRDTEEGGDGVLDDVDLEQRVDRFEMMGLEALQQQEARRIRHLEDENLALKDRLFLVQQEVDELRDRLRGNDSPQSCLES